MDTLQSIFVDLSAVRSESLKDLQKTSLNHFERFLREMKMTDYRSLNGDDVNWELFGKFGSFLAIEIKAMNTALSYLSAMRSQLVDRFAKEKCVVLGEEKIYAILRDALVEIYSDRCDITGEPLINSHGAVDRSTRIYVNNILFIKGMSNVEDIMNMNVPNWDFNLVGRIMEIVKLKYSKMRYLEEMQCHKSEIDRKKNNKQCNYTVSPNKNSYLPCPLFTLSTYIVLSKNPVVDLVFPKIPARGGARYVNAIFSGLLNELKVRHEQQQQDRGDDDAKFEEYEEQEVVEIDVSMLTKLKKATTHGLRVSAIDALSENAKLPFSGATDRAEKGPLRGMNHSSFTITYIEE